jgi:hypothetical protein
MDSHREILRRFSEVKASVTVCVRHYALRLKAVCGHWWTIFRNIAHRPVQWTWSAAVFQVPLFFVSCFWIRYDVYSPSIGVAIGVLGFASIVMAIRSEHFTRMERVMWVVIASMLLYVEIGAIRRQDEQQAKKRTEETNRFEALINGLKSVLDEQKTSTTKVTKDLRHSAQLIQRGLIGRLTEVKSFRLDWFLSDYGPDIERYIEANLPQSLDVTAPSEDDKLLLKAMLCSFPGKVSKSYLSISLAQNLSFEIEAHITKAGNCEPAEQLVAYPRTESFYSNVTQKLAHRRDELTVVQRQKKRAAWSTPVWADDIQALGLSPPLTADSFRFDSMPEFAITVENDWDVQEVANYVKRMLPRSIGVKVEPLTTREQWGTARVFTARPEPDIFGRNVIVYFEPTKRPESFDSDYSDILVPKPTKP